MTEQPGAAPAPRPTGEPAVDAALELLHGLDSRPVHAHADVYDDVHQRLQGALADADADAADGEARDRLQT